jgi:hypothetical protein
MLADTIISYICDMPYSETGAGGTDFPISLHLLFLNKFVRALCF